MTQFTKESLITVLRQIQNHGWVESVRSPGNDGAVGNTLESILGISENNLPLPNATEWELKAKRRKTVSLTTLFHLEPSPQAMKLVSSLLLPFYGWPHATKAGEMSFRQTIMTTSPSDRGFQVIVNRAERKVEISFNASRVAARHKNWLSHVQQQIGLHQLSPQPYWGFSDLEHNAGIKLKNTFFVLADSKVQRGKEYFHYDGLLMLQGFDFRKFLDLLEKGIIYIDFDASTTHNHGTKFRIRKHLIPSLYAQATQIFEEPLNKADLLKPVDTNTLQPFLHQWQAEDLELAKNDDEEEF